MINDNAAKLLNVDYGVIGRTVSTKFEPNTSSKFYFWMSAKEETKGKIEIGNIVAAFADNEDDITFGLVSEMRSYSDVDSFIADFLSHNFGEATVLVPTDISQVIVVTCDVMRNISSKTRPVGRSRVYFPSRLGIEFAYGIVNAEGESIFSGKGIPVGVFANGDETLAAISVDENFLIGPEGAHLNVTGISGLASKTSAIEFVLKSLLTHTSKKVAVVMFNVKSKDLLYIDIDNPKLEIEEWSRNVYTAFNIPVEPFNQTKFFAPADPKNPGKTSSYRKQKIEAFSWDLHEIYRDIPSLFSPMDWDDKMEGVWYVIRDLIEQQNSQILTYAQMLNWIEREINNASNSKSQQQYIRGNHILTWNKMLSHLKRFPNSYPGLIKTAGQGNPITFNKLSDKDVYVIDIQMLNDSGQRLVFGRAIRQLSDILEDSDSQLDAIIVFVDELNKFAPSGNVRTPLKSHLIDITARGRSIGLVLFGAEQFASSVDKEIIENSSTFLFGRTESNELRSPNYSSFSDEIKTKLMTLPQGYLLIKFAKFPQPIFIQFPYPPCIPGDQYIEK